MTRFLLYCAALLVLLNTAAFMWPDKTSNASHVHSSKDEISPHFVRLNKEIEDRFYSLPIEEIVDDLSDETLDRSTELSLAPSETNPEVETEGCYRVGPFLHQANYELAQAVLFNAGVDYKKSKRASKESSVFRIYLGPFETQADVDDARLDLKGKSVLDHFVRKYDDGLFMISLGIYSTPETADAALRLFNDKLGDVKQRNENVVLPDSYWLHFEVSEDDPTLGQLRVIDWGGPSARMGQFNCST